MSNYTTQHTPADMRERVAFEAFAWEHGRRGAAAEWIRAQWQGETPKWRAMYFDLADRILALVRTPRGEGEEVWPGDAENDASFLRSWARYLRTEAQDIREAQDWADWKQQAEYTEVAAARMDQIANRIAALRSEAQREEDVGEFCHLCGEEFDPRESGTVIGPLGQDDGVPRWYRCPRCARAYDAGYQQGQRDPRGDETADPTAIRSDAQGEVWREIDDLLARLERFEYDAAGESEEYWRVVAMRERIAAARRGEGGGDGK